MDQTHEQVAGPRAADGPLRAEDEDLARSTVSRPRSGMVSWFTRGLGPLPDMAEPDVDAYPGERPSWWLAAGMAATMMTALWCVMTTWPWLHHTSPVGAVELALTRGLAAGRAGTAQGPSPVFVWGVTALLLVVLSGLVRLGPCRAYAKLYRMALAEEGIFRAGTESWTTRQRIVSCLQFGLVHLLNLIVNLGICALLAVLGLALSTAYLRRLRATGDPVRALSWTAHLHARYNYVVFGTGLLVLCAETIATLAGLAGL